MKILRRLIRLFLSHQPCQRSADVYVHRRASVRENVSEASRVTRFLLVSLRDSLLIGQEKMESSQRVMQRKMVKR